MKRYKFALAIALLLSIVRLLAAGSVEKKPFGKLPDGRPVMLYTLTGPRGLLVSVMDYGASIVSIQAPDRNQKLGDVVLGFSSFDPYRENAAFFGSVVGRVANRTADARFTLDGKTYQLAANNSPGGMPCSLHGGEVGFDKVLWKGEPYEVGGRQGLRLDNFSKDGDQGFPGNLSVRVEYSMTDENGLRIDYEARTDAPTPVNLSNHTYFNLSGEGSGDILSHELIIRATHYTPVNKGLIPSGEIAPVKETPFDFTKSHRIDAGLNESNEQLSLGGGYDHNFVIDRKSTGLELAATVYDPKTGRVLDVLTTEPGLQFYCGNFLDGTIVGKSGKPYIFRSAIVLEPQHYPDSINQPKFPSIILRPGATYTSSTEFRFSAK